MIGKQNSRSMIRKKAVKITIIVLSILLALTVFSVGALHILYKLGKTSLLNQSGISSTDSDIISVNEDIIIYGGAKHRLNENIVSILFLGVDKEDINSSSVIGKNGQADSIFLACIDTVTKDVKIIPISRETMVDIDRYSVDGSYMGVKNEQICLSYAYGEDAKTGCENTKNAVSRLLCGIGINSCVAIDFSGIAPLTRKLGGVEVKAIETIGSFTEGKKVTLKGDRATEYVRLRGTDTEANNRRIARQKQFLSAFINKAGNEILGNFTKFTGYYNAAKPYITSDLDLAELTYIADTCLVADMGSKIEYISIEGETVEGEEYVEFYADSESIYKAVLEAFYIKFN